MSRPYQYLVKMGFKKIITDETEWIKLSIQLTNPGRKISQSKIVLGIQSSESPAGRTSCSLGVPQLNSVILSVWGGDENVDTSLPKFELQRQFL